MKTPEKTKRGLEHCIHADDCNGCVYAYECAIATDCNPMHKDALAYIQQLERDKEALLEDMRGRCAYCKHSDKSTLEEPCLYCSLGSHDRWEWRGAEEDENV